MSEATTTADTSICDGPVHGDPHKRGAAKGVRWLLLLLALSAAGFAVVRGLWQSPAEDSAADVQVVSRGATVDMAAHAVAGKYTIYDFYADWCPLCHPLADQLHQLAADHPNVAIRKIDVTNWETPIVEQHGLVNLPYMIVYGPDQKPLAKGNEVYSKLHSIFQVELP